MLIIYLAHAAALLAALGYAIFKAEPDGRVILGSYLIYASTGLLLLWIAW